MIFCEMFKNRKVQNSKYHMKVQRPKYQNKEKYKVELELLFLVEQIGQRVP